MLVLALLLYYVMQNKSRNYASENNVSVHCFLVLLIRPQVCLKPSICSIPPFPDGLLIAANDSAEQICTSHFRHFISPLTV